MNNCSAKDSFLIFEEKDISERQSSVATTVSIFVVSLLFHVVTYQVLHTVGQLVVFLIFMDDRKF